MKSVNIEAAYKNRLTLSSEHEIDSHIRCALEELGKINQEIAVTTRRNGYKLFPDSSVHIGDYGNNHEIERRYLCHNNGEALSTFPLDDIALVTGFGTTDSPSPGTMSMIFRLLEMQKDAGVYVSAIVSDFGTLNSRNIDANISANITMQLTSFIEELGFDSKKGELRTHNNKEYGRLLPLITSCLSIQDFDYYTEATDDLYRDLNIFRGDFAMYTYKAMMATDILLPLASKGKKAVVVTTGLEEHYHPNFARFVGKRFMEMGGGYETIFPDCFQISALYSKMINGFFPYAKMSRSIPASSLCIGDSEQEIRKKIGLTDDISNIVIYQMMELMSGWDEYKLNAARMAFEQDCGWDKYKEDFLEYFLSLHHTWKKCAPKNYISFSNFVFDK